MKVILLDDIDKLGKLGDVVQVEKGYARNFLFPRNLAVEALDKNLKILEIRKRKKAEQLAKEKAEMQALADRISSTSITVAMAAGEEDKLFGSVTADHIAEAFKVEGIEIDRKKISLTESIRKLGVYPIEIKLHPEITATTKVWVVKK
ncbi:MAG: 50S ribosomal protein L9 [Candidatus Omnitrophica bacterium]|nr:50S ribosomal protein L9 [Candidatus Omnitrophota bacterium]